MRRIFARAGAFLFWLAAPYLVAAFLLRASKIISASKRPRREAFALGKGVAEITRSIMNSDQLKESLWTSKS